jgi:hypothetical protein
VKSHVQDCEFIRIARRFSAFQASPDLREVLGGGCHRDQRHEVRFPGGARFDQIQWADLYLSHDGVRADGAVVSQKGAPADLPGDPPLRFQQIELPTHVMAATPEQLGQRTLGGYPTAGFEPAGKQLLVQIPDH